MITGAKLAFLTVFVITSIISILYNKNEMQNNKKCLKAQRVRDDEFYTRRDDVYKELTNYNYFGQRVACPFDTDKSEFVRYFKNLVDICACSSLVYSHKEIGTMEYTRNGLQKLNDNGDFFADNAEWRKCSYVVSNPPFSKVREVGEVILQEARQRDDFTFILLVTNLILTRTVWRNAFIDGVFSGGFSRADSRPFDRPDGTSRNVSCVYVTNKNIDNGHYKTLSKKHRESVDGLARYAQKYNGRYIYEIPTVADLPTNTGELLAFPTCAFWRLPRNTFKIYGRVSDLGIDERLENGGAPFHRLVIERVKTC